MPVKIMKVFWRVEGLKKSTRVERVALPNSSTTWTHKRRTGPYRKPSRSHGMTESLTLSMDSEWWTSAQVASQPWLSLTSTVHLITGGVLYASSKNQWLSPSFAPTPASTLSFSSVCFCKPTDAIRFWMLMHCLTRAQHFGIIWSWLAESSAGSHQCTTFFGSFCGVSTRAWLVVPIGTTARIHSWHVQIDGGPRCSGSRTLCHNRRVPWSDACLRHSRFN